MITPLNQNVLVERDRGTSDMIIRKSGIITPKGQVEDEGLVTGTILWAPKDQNLLIDKERAVNELHLEVGMKVWYSRYSTGIVFDDREEKEGELLDLVPLEDLRAVVG